jgi:hypothetical protein
MGILLKIGSILAAYYIVRAIWAHYVRDYYFKKFLKAWDNGHRKGISLEDFEINFPPTIEMIFEHPFAWRKRYFFEVYKARVDSKDQYYQSVNND